MRAMFLTTLALAVGYTLVTTSARAADVPDGTLYRCPGNDYKTTITEKEAAKLGCKRIEGGPVSPRDDSPRQRDVPRIYSRDAAG